jgi:D-alanyl-lipoteichoic acid acyltransferase DltB (MBOAT superfamily)
VLALACHASLFASFAAWPGLRQSELAAAIEADLVPVFVAYYVLRLLAGYAAHSGTASVQIGLMRMLGHEVPERYRYPLLASSPIEFWRRWNTYVGSWARRYVYVPAATKLRRRLGPTPIRAAVAVSLAVLLTFGVVGLLHDFGVFVLHRNWPLGGLVVFTLNGLAVLVWFAASRLARAIRDRKVPVLGPSLGSTVSRLCFIPLLLATVWIAVPTMSSDLKLTIADVWHWIGQPHG